ncbi:MAG: NTP transferase domain-containing protein [Roseobacter sp.]
MSFTPLPVVILAAGQSRRMRGSDKLMEDIGGTPLLMHQVAKAVSIGPVYVTLPPQPHPRWDVVADQNVTCVPVPGAKTSMSASLRAGLAALPKSTQAAMLLLADLPSLTVQDLTRVAAAVDLDSKTMIWRGSTADGAPGHPVVFRASLFPKLMQVTGDSGGAEVIKAHKNTTEHVALPLDHARRDLDTPEDWAKWRKDTK